MELIFFLELMKKEFVFFISSDGLHYLNAEKQQTASPSSWWTWWVFPQEHHSEHDPSTGMSAQQFRLDMKD